MYLLLLLVGVFGFVAMTLLGMSHGIGGHQGGGHHGVALPHPKVSLPGHAASHHPASATSTHHPAQTQPSGAGGDPWKLLMAVSPIDIFSVILGAGATGILVKTFLSGPLQGVAALIGGLFFALAVIRPTMGFLMGFATRPSEGLEGEVSSIGEATTRFDASGRGVIKLILDEQVVQLLATLESSEREKGVQVARGEKVVLISVDSVRNSCVVSRELAPSEPEAPAESMP